jgi:PhzF family phenazine biosynthesis protein
VRAFRQVDVFGQAPYRGNPVAVVLEADGLATEQMQALARWTNLSETTFVLPPTTPEADYRVRIFTPGAELPFAGHPTLGTCHAWLEAGGQPRSDEGEVVQQCDGGLVRLRRIGDRLAFAAPPLVRSGPVSADLLERVLHGLRLDAAAVLDAAWVDNGPGWLAVRLADAAAVLAVRPGPLDELYVGVVGPYPEGSEAAVEVRAFFPGDSGTLEDPVTGSLNASLAGWLASAGVVRLPYLASQGSVLGRAGRVHVSADPEEPGQVWVGGATVTCVSGSLAL